MPCKLDTWSRCLKSNTRRCQQLFVKTLIFVIALFPCTFVTALEKNCFLVKEKNSILKQEGDCQLRYAPCSTFKIFLSLIGYDANILQDEFNPVWAFKDGYPDYIQGWKEPHHPTLWIKNSCLWYSQSITQKLGLKNFQNYIVKFNYGNQDVSGDKNKNNGLTNAWLSSSLEISPEEQTVFLQNLIDNKLPVNFKSHKMTKKILFLEELPNGWQLYGKTGSGLLLSEDRLQKLEIQHGWFIGWIQKGDRTITFVHHIVDDKKNDTYAGPRAKIQAKEKLLDVIKK